MKDKPRYRIDFNDGMFPEYVYIIVRLDNEGFTDPSSMWYGFRQGKLEEI